MTLILILAASRVAKIGGVVTRTGRRLATLTFVVASLDVALLDVATLTSDQLVTWIVIDADPVGALTGGGRKIANLTVTSNVGVIEDFAGTLVVEGARMSC